MKSLTVLFAKISLRYGSAELCLLRETLFLMPQIVFTSKGKLLMQKHFFKKKPSNYDIRANNFFWNIILFGFDIQYFGLASWPSKINSWVLQLCLILSFCHTIVTHCYITVIAVLDSDLDHSFCILSLIALEWSIKLPRHDLYAVGTHMTNFSKQQSGFWLCFISEIWYL